MLIKLAVATCSVCLLSGCMLYKPTLLHVGEKGYRVTDAQAAQPGTWGYKRWISLKERGFYLRDNSGYEKQGEVPWPDDVQYTVTAVQTQTVSEKDINAIKAKNDKIGAQVETAFGHESKRKGRYIVEEVNQDSMRKALNAELAELRDDARFQHDDLRIVTSIVRVYDEEKYKKYTQEIGVGCRHSRAREY